MDKIAGKKREKKAEIERERKYLSFLNCYHFFSKCLKQLTP